MIAGGKKMVECDELEGFFIPIAWRDDKRVFEPFICYDVNGNIVFYDYYVCPEYRCPTYNVETLQSPVFSYILTKLDSGVNIDDVDKLDSIEKELIKKLKEKGVRIVDYKIIYWCYTGDKKCEKEADEQYMDALRDLAKYLNHELEIVEIREEDEGNSILIVIPPDDIPKLYSLLD